MPVTIGLRIQLAFSRNRRIALPPTGTRTTGNPWPLPAVSNSLAYRFTGNAAEAEEVL